MTKNNVVSLEDRRFVKRFVDIYLDQGAVAAGQYAYAQGIGDDEKEMTRLRKVIKAEFERRGYEMNSAEEQTS